MKNKLEGKKNTPQNYAAHLIPVLFSVETFLKLHFKELLGSMGVFASTLPECCLRYTDKIPPAIISDFGKNVIVIDTSKEQSNISVNLKV